MLFVRMSVRTGYFNDMNKVNYKVPTLLEHLNIRFHRNTEQLSMSLTNILHKIRYAKYIDNLNAFIYGSGTLLVLEKIMFLNLLFKLCTLARYCKTTFLCNKNGSINKLCKYRRIFLNTYVHKPTKT